MTKRYKTLQKKLQELEAELSLIFSLPAETPYHHLLSECIQQRFVFSKNLLSAEIASHPSKPRHLRHIGERLAELEIAFWEWDDYRRSVVNYNFDTASVCSCNESCRNDDGEEASDLAPEMGSFEDEAQQNSPRALVKVKVQQGNGNLGSREVVEGQRENSPRAKVNVKVQEGKEKVGNEDSSSFEHEVQQNCTPSQVNVKVQEGKEKIGNEVAVEKKKGSIFALAKYSGVLIAGMVLGAILMGAAIAMLGDRGSSYSTPHEGSLFFT